jgi:hypothetical protein
MPNYTDILQECIKTANERQEQYGEATESLTLCKEILSNVFKVELTVSQICHVLVALKLSRQGNKFKEDNLIDIINYLSISLFAERKNNAKK